MKLSNSRVRKPFVKALVQKHKIDFIVLDEVQSAKSRGQVESKRRQLTNYLLMEAAKVNTDMRVLAMSATPVRSQSKFCSTRCKDSFHNRLKAQSRRTDHA